MAYQHKFRFRHFIIFKDQVLGHGSYGAVYKARCDQLTCAAKVLHPTIVDPYDPGAGKILQRFQQECDFLNHIRHPHIVQYLGVCQDPESKLPVLLMELLDSSLTKMLKNSPHPIPYHIQVDLCSDVSVAVAYLHSNGIIHRDLSGNNVLVVAGRRAKVTDFGMSELATRSEYLTPLTMCPGTLGYMSPESLKESPQYTEKLDVFSQGVIIIQVCTRQFPDPAPAMKEVNDPRSPTGSLHIPVLEPERRKKHIDLIDPIHPLLSIALDCLKYRGRDRPSAEELCQRLAVLKESQEYIEISQQLSPVTTEVNRILQQEREKLVALIEKQNTQIFNRDQLIEEHQQNITIKDQQLATKNEQIAVKDRQIAEYQQEIREKMSLKHQQIAAKDREIDLLHAQLCELKQKLVKSPETNQQLQRQTSACKKQSNDLSQRLQLNVVPVPKPRRTTTTNSEANLTLKWSDGANAPFKVFRQGMVVEGNVAYFTSNTNVYSFDSFTRKWNSCISLPSCPQTWGSLAIVKGLLTMIGGWLSFKEKSTNKLVSQNGVNSEWIEQLPPMPTSRFGTTATAFQSNLIVAGGLTKLDNSSTLDKVEVLNTDTLVWSTAASLPHPLRYGSATVCGDRLYMLGGNDKHGPCRSVFMCLLSELHQKRTSIRRHKLKQTSLWQCITDTPMLKSTCAIVRGELLAVGGRDDSETKTTAVYKYDQNTKSWNIISHMRTARSSCYVAVMDNNEMLIVNGHGMDGETDIIEIASY